MAAQKPDVKALEARIRELEGENDILNEKIDTALELFADGDEEDQDECDLDDEDLAGEDDDLGDCPGARSRSGWQTAPKVYRRFR